MKPPRRPEPEADPNEPDVGSGRDGTLLADAVYRALRRSIVSIEDEPGSILTEKAVSQRFGVARPTAKAALERLVAAGLLHRSAHRAAVVPLLSPADIEDLYATRLVVEQAVVERLASRGRVPAQAVAAQDVLRKNAHRDDQGAFAAADLMFHQALVAAIGSARMTRMHDLILGEVELCMGQLEIHSLVSVVDVLKQHQGILDAIESRDPELAVFLMRRHILGARDRLLTGFEDLPAHQKRNRVHAEPEERQTDQRVSGGRGEPEPVVGPGASAGDAGRRRRGGGRRGRNTDTDPDGS